MSDRGIKGWDGSGPPMRSGDSGESEGYEMSEYVTLVGSEAVQSAGYAMRSAAEDMNKAASQMDSSIQDLKQFMDDWLIRFKDVMAKAPEPQTPKEYKFDDRFYHGQG